MPNYDYKCKKCDHRFQRFQSMTDKVLTNCPACKKKALIRLIGKGVYINFTGSGFYVTDSCEDRVKKKADK